MDKVKLKESDLINFAGIEVSDDTAEFDNLVNRLKHGVYQKVIVLAEDHEANDRLLSISCCIQPYLKKDNKHFDYSPLDYKKSLRLYLHVSGDKGELHLKKVDNYIGNMQVSMKCFNRILSENNYEGIPDGEYPVYYIEKDGYVISAKIVYELPRKEG